MGQTNEHIQEWVEPCWNTNRNIPWKQEPRSSLTHPEPPSLHHSQRILAKLDRLLHLLHQFGRYLEVVTPTSQRSGVATWGAVSAHHPRPVPNPRPARASCEVPQCSCHVVTPRSLLNWRRGHIHQTRARIEVTPGDWKNDPVEDLAHKHHLLIHSSYWAADSRLSAVSSASRTPHGDGSLESLQHHPPGPLAEASRGRPPVCTYLCSCDYATLGFQWLSFHMHFIWICITVSISKIRIVTSYESYAL